MNHNPSTFESIPTPERHSLFRKAIAIAAAGSAVTMGSLISSQEAVQADEGPNAIVTSVEPTTYDPTVVGDTVQGPTFPLMAVHASVGYNETTGEWQVLAVEGSGNEKAQFERGEYKAMLFTPSTEAIQVISSPNEDLFCSVQTHLPGEGKLLIAGGTSYYADEIQNYGGTEEAYTFDFSTGQFTQVESMDEARWYPAATVLGSGRVAIVGGLKANGFNASTHEWFDWQTNTFSPMTPQVNWPLYVNLITDPRTGNLIKTGAYSNMLGNTQPGIWNPNTGEFKNIDGLTALNKRAGSMGMLLPPAQTERYAVVGGGHEIDKSQTSNLTVEIYDHKQANEGALGSVLGRYLVKSLLSKPTVHPNMVALPDDKTLIIGGSRKYAQETIAQAYLMDNNGGLTVVDPNRIGRSYHSTAVLLGDGRILLAGSNPNSDVNNPSKELRTEIYSPPYLFRPGERPEIDIEPTEAFYGSTVTGTVQSDASVASVRLIRPMAVTHTNDNNMRSVAANFRVNGSEIEIDIPANPNLLPPGPWMVFAFDNQGRLVKEADYLRVNHDPDTGSEPPLLPLPQIPLIKLPKLGS